jgi:hypothetical protein
MFFLMATLCAGLACDNYVIDTMSEKDCTSEITLATMSYRVEQITLLGSFKDVQCVSEDAPITDLIYARALPAKAL